MLQLVCLKVVFKVNISSSFLKPRKECKESVSSVVQKCVPERPREYDLLTIRWMMVLKNTTFNYEEATRK
jgi:hypothetical protein